MCIRVDSNNDGLTIGLGGHKEEKKKRIRRKKRKIKFCKFVIIYLFKFYRNII